MENYDIIHPYKVNLNDVEILNKEYIHITKESSRFLKAEYKDREFILYFLDKENHSEHDSDVIYKIIFLMNGQKSKQSLKDWTYLISFRKDFADLPVMIHSFYQIVPVVE